MILRIDPRDPTHVYEQIRGQLLTMISAGTLAPGTQLPTIRQLASDLGLAKGTISKAYEALFRDGAIESRGRHGTVVADRPLTLNAKERAARISDAALQFALAVRQLGATPTEAKAQFDLALRGLDEGAA